MSDVKPEIEGIDIVLVGDFNPSIFQPAWFTSQELIRKEEANAARIDIIHPEIVQFSLEWLQVQITRNKFSASTSQSPYYPVLKDLVYSTFSLLKHTPISKMGINKNMHFLMSSEDEWHALGHKLAPKHIWDDILRKPGMRSLSIQGERPDEYKGYVLVRVEPSRKIHPGVFIHVNDHYEVQDPKSAMGCTEIMNTLINSWEISINRADKIGFTLVGQK